MKLPFCEVASFAGKQSGSYRNCLHRKNGGTFYEVRGLSKNSATIFLFHNRKLQNHEIWQVDKTTCML